MWLGFELSVMAWKYYLIKCARQGCQNSLTKTYISDIKLNDHMCIKFQLVLISITDRSSRLIHPHSQIKIPISRRLKFRFAAHSFWILIFETRSNFVENMFLLNWTLPKPSLKSHKMKYCTLLNLIWKDLGAHLLYIWTFAGVLREDSR